MPIKAFREIPLAPLSKLTSHKQKLFAGMSPHIAVKRSQIGEALPEITGHLIYQRSLYMNDFIMRKWEYKIFGVRVHQRKRDIVVMVTPKDRIQMHVL